VSLRLLLLAAFAYVLLLAILALEVPLALNVSRRVNAEVKAQAASEAQLVAASASGRTGDALDGIVETAAGQLGGRVIVVDEQGRLVSDSAGAGLVGSSYADRPEIRQALATDRTAQQRRRSETLDEEVLFTAAPIVDEGELGAVRITQGVEAIDERVRRDVLGLAAVGLAALAFGLLFAWVLAGTLSRPLRGLAAAARRVEAGDLDARADPGGAREQREVAEAFNDMTDRLGRVLESQREFVANASHQLRTPLTGLRLRIEAASLKADDPSLGNDPGRRGPLRGRALGGAGCERGLPDRPRRRRRRPGCDER
jgi:signal transduction histidine kinase